MTTQNQLLTFLMSFLFSVSAIGGGDVVNNGGGTSEMTVVYAHQNYGSLVEVCTRSATCDLAIDEDSLLKAIVNQLPKEQSLALIFHSKVEMGTQLFSTGDSVGSPVQINKDALWNLDSLGTQQSYTLSDALNLLTLAWGRHQLQFARKTQISLAKKLALRALVGKAAYLPNLQSANLQLLTINDQKIDQMYLVDGHDSFLNLHQLILLQLPCRAHEFFAYSFQWSPQHLEEESATWILLNGRIGWKCNGSETSQHTASLGIKFKVQPSLNSTQGPPKMIDQSVQLDISNITGL